MIFGKNKLGLHEFRSWRISCLFLAILSLSTVVSCATSGGIQNVERTRGYRGEAGRTREGIVYVPRGAYLVGNSAQSLAVGTWIRALPSASWPEGIAKPTILVGRIASKEPFGARIEILAAQSSLRDSAPAVEFYAPNRSNNDAKKDASQVNPSATPRLHAMPKRLVYPLSTPSASDTTVATGLGANDWVEGSEIYGIVDLTNRAETRLASQITGIATIVETTLGRDEIAVARVAGQWPGAQAAQRHNAENCAFVLLDAPDLPLYGVRISIYGSKGNGLKTRIESILEPGLPGRDRIRIDWHKSAISPTALSDMSQQETDMLEIRVFEDGDQIDAYDQGLRVGRLPWRAALRDLDPAGTPAATAIAMNALGLLGYHDSAAYIGERSWNASTPDEKSALAPALAEAYHAMARDDWALEIGFEIAGYAKQSSGSLKYKLLAAQSTIMSMTSRSDEFSSIYEAVYRHIGDLSMSWQRSFRYALMASGSEAHDALLHKLLRSRKTKSGLGAWNEIDDWQLCLMAFERTATETGGDSGAWDEYCEARAQNAQWALTTAAYEALEIMQDRSDASGDSHMSEMLASAARIDELGYPHLASILWREIALHASTDEAVIKSWQNAAQYARTAQQKRLYLQMMAELARWMRQKSLSLSGDIFAQALAGWRALDMRQPLAEMFIARAQSADRTMASDLLKLAADLFLSSGDGANYEAVRSIEKQSHAK